jgi:hypothetical protein
MPHFVRFAKVSADGSVDRVGWRLRIFPSSHEARAFAHGLVGKAWRVEIGAYQEAEASAPAGLVQRFRAQALRGGERLRNN